MLPVGGSLIGERRSREVIGPSRPPCVGLNILVDGRRQRRVIKKDVSRMLKTGVLRWNAGTAAGKPFQPGSRHVGWIELVSSHRNRRGKTIIRRTRLSTPFFVCA